MLNKYDRDKTLITVTWMVRDIVNTIAELTKRRVEDITDEDVDKVINDINFELWQDEAIQLGWERFIEPVVKAVFEEDGE